MCHVKNRYYPYSLENGLIATVACCSHSACTQAHTGGLSVASARQRRLTRPALCFSCELSNGQLPTHRQASHDEASSAQTRS